MFSKLKIAIGIFVTIVIFQSCNPFAPVYDEDGLADQFLLGDRTTVDGMFDYFKSSYEIRDTSLYGKLFAPDFTFTYFDFGAAAEISWDRGQEMLTSWKLFRGVQQITLDWNFYIEKEENDTLANVVRNFNLTIVENSNQVYSGTGRAKMKLRRKSPGEVWEIYYWFDDSDF